MIRRWSYINQFNLTSLISNNFEKKYKIISFQNLVNLKKFFYNYTKFKRKSLSRIKHKTTWLIYTNLISLWAKDFIFIKKYSKIQFFYNIFFYNMFFYNFNFIKNKNNIKLINNFNFIYLFFNRKIFNYFNFNFKIFKNINLLYGYNNIFNFKSNEVLPISLKFEDNFYFINQLKTNLVFSDTFLFSLILNKITELYKILILVNYYLLILKC